MESLRSGVEPFILCAEFLNVDISKIAVMAALTVNLRSPCNVILTCSSFPCLCQKARFEFLASLVNTQEQAGRGRRIFHDRIGWEVWGAAVLKSTPLLCQSN